MVENANLTNEDVCLDAGKQKQKQDFKNSKKEFNVNDYLNTRLAEGETKKTLKIRLVLTKDIDGRNKFAIPVETHSIMLNPKQQQAGVISKSKFKSFICLNDPHINGGEDGCPLCNKKQEMFNEANSTAKKGSDEWRAMCKAAYKFDSKTTYISRCILRGAEDEGIKFFRYNKRDDGSGIWDSIVELYNQYKEDGINIFDYKEGYDIRLILSKDPNPTPGAPEKTIIKVNIDTKSTPLADSDEQIQAWVNDDKDWRDMYRSKSYDYLKIVAEGESPVWDTETNSFKVWKSPEELQQENIKVEQQAAEALRETPVIPQPQPVNNEQEEELPF